MHFRSNKLSHLLLNKRERLFAYPSTVLNVSRNTCSSRLLYILIYTDTTPTKQNVLSHQGWKPKPKPKNLQIVITNIYQYSSFNVERQIEKLLILIFESLVSLYVELYLSRQAIALLTQPSELLRIVVIKQKRQEVEQWFPTRSPRTPKGFVKSLLGGRECIDI